MFADSHIHVGQFREIYEQPKELVKYLFKVGVTHFAVSSTSICKDNYIKAIAEIREVITLAPSCVFPILWITPLSLQNGGVKLFLDSGINWKCIKIHPWLTPGEWSRDSANIKKAIELSRRMKLPFLIHTGETEGCLPSLFEDVIKENSDIYFILAHGRPISETINLMKKYKNVWTDTAFMPIKHVSLLCQNYLSDRILWGSDYPIPKYYYPDLDICEYYKNLIFQLKQSVNKEDFEKITHINFYNLFG